MLRKKRNEKNSLSLRQFFVLIALIFPLLGANQREPIEQIFDRLAINNTIIRMRAAGCHGVRVYMRHN